MLGAFVEIPFLPIISGAAVVVLLILWAAVRSKKRS